MVQEVLQNRDGHSDPKTPAAREASIIREQNDRLYRRAPGKYEKITRTFHALSHWVPLAPAIEVAYHFCRLVDDIADGDVPLPPGCESFAQFLEELKSSIYGSTTVSFEEGEVVFLLKRMLAKLDRNPSEAINHRQETEAFLDAMRVEHDKRVEGAVFTREQLEALYSGSFGPPHMLAFAALRSNCSGETIADLFQLQGRLYAVRDLIPELSKGIIFIPLEVMEEAGLSKEALVSEPEEACKNPIIQRWIVEEDGYGLQTIVALREKAKNLPWDVRAVVEFLVKPIEVNIRTRRAIS